MPEAKRTLIVFEMLQPYATEISTVMALPIGFRLRFRYKRKWFALDDPTKIIQTECLIALRVTATGEILPVRTGQIFDVKDVGGIFYIEVSAGRFVQLHAGREGQEAQLKRFNRELRDGPLAGVDNPPGIGMEKLVFLTPDYTNQFENPLFMGDQGNREVSAWGTLVELLLTFDEYKTLDFLYVLGLEPEASFPEAGDEEGVILLEGNSHYTISVLQRRKLVDPPKDVLLITDKSTLVPILDRQVAVGAYDILRFSFYTAESTSYQKISSIVLKATSDSKDVSLFPPLIMPIAVAKKSLLVEVLLVTLFFIAATVLLAPVAVSKALSLSLPLVQGDIRNVAILTAILTSNSVGALGKSLISKLYKAG